METSVAPLHGKKFKQLSCTKVMLTLFWDMKVLILAQFHPHGTTVNCPSYCTVLQDTLKHAIHQEDKDYCLMGARKRYCQAPYPRRTADTAHKHGFELLVYLI
ncbi:hypothetical protein AVEN_198537-1 [Araneus ventricosus]|uniref:Uncharacterized protein n=1 Tax=Araneus ventricosus TaxID=182803 RepID=A0A4Y2HWS4_ARAVE|nr:hypothetical protein AVEN_198537-1 [Araneus ventricosus]